MAATENGGRKKIEGQGSNWNAESCDCEKLEQPEKKEKKKKKKEDPMLKPTPIIIVQEREEEQERKPSLCSIKVTSYGKGVFQRPGSQYAQFFCILCVVGAFCIFFFGAAWASIHHEKVRYSFWCFCVLPIMACSFMFFLGLSPSRVNNGMSSNIWMGDEDEDRVRRGQLGRVLGIIMFCFGGAFLGISLAYFRWYDTALEACLCPVLNCTTIAPTKRPLGTTAPPTTSPTTSPPTVFPNSYIPANLLLFSVILMLLGVVLAWLSLVFQEAEIKLLQQRRDGITEEMDEMM
jgi:hypothetical protein